MAHFSFNEPLVTVRAKWVILLAADTGKRRGLDKRPASDDDGGSADGRAQNDRRCML